MLGEERGRKKKEKKILSEKIEDRGKTFSLIKTGIVIKKSPVSRKCVKKKKKKRNVTLKHQNCAADEWEI